MPTKKESYRFKTFYTAIEDKTHFRAPTGSGIREEYQYEYDENNRKVLKKTNEINMYLEIQKHKDACDVSKIIARAKMGDTSMLRKDGVYADFSSIPDNLIECQKEWNKVENFFNSQPVEVRRKYNFDINQFAADIGKESWLINTGLLNPMPAAERAMDAPKTTVPVPETKTE